MYYYYDDLSNTPIIKVTSYQFDKPSHACVYIHNYTTNVVTAVDTQHIVTKYIVELEITCRPFTTIITETVQLALTLITNS